MSGQVGASNNLLGAGVAQNQESTGGKDGGMLASLQNLLGVGSTESGSKQQVASKSLLGRDLKQFTAEYYLGQGGKVNHVS